ncbi:hypothetical protein [Lysobacter gummosus]|uniref:hypothetical protein n=1 Tax=Lysobacter gummosus TaxID=262324 RepID=UPI003624F2FF
METSRSWPPTCAVRSPTSSCRPEGRAAEPFERGAVMDRQLQQAAQTYERVVPRMKRPTHRWLSHGPRLRCGRVEGRITS